ncbi:MAG: peptidoglycan DD-metalloendopeptidase family protein, partial [Actinomycetota bacterium]|nr:peptidoglycan DD-metalloendopeptidase family protein [Actinomycetota bacterium]
MNVFSMSPKIAVCITIAWLVAPSRGAGAAEVSSLWLAPPVDGPVVERFREPATKWGEGHRGIDYAVARGTAVRAAAAGDVAFAGQVAGILAVTIDHGVVQTTYSSLATVDVTEGQHVGRGHWIGSAGSAHPGGSDGLHLGVKI